jgi:hypothetical protein
MANRHFTMHNVDKFPPYRQDYRPNISAVT